MLSALGVECFELRQQSDLLRSFDGLILPGGESTVQGKLLRELGMFDELQQQLRAGLPVLGTCAGLILLAKQLVGEPSHLGVMDITVRRNAYGRQINSFSVTDSIPPVADHPLSLTFIRAPWIEEAGRGVQVLHTLRGKITAAREDRLLATTFHPELTADPAFHRYFTGIVRGSLPV